VARSWAYFAINFRVERLTTKLAAANQTEHMFAYRNHPEVWQEASPITGEGFLAPVVYQ